MLFLFWFHSSIALLLFCGTPLNLAFPNGVCDPVNKDTWRECPEHPSVYTGCNYTFHAVWRTVDLTCIGSNYTYTVEVNKDDLTPSVESINGSLHCCLVSVETVIKGAYHFIEYLAANKKPPIQPKLQECTDTLDIHVLSYPKDITIISSPGIFNITWSAPDVLEGYSIYQYNISILNYKMENYIAKTSKETYLEILKDDLNASSCVEIFAVYCGGAGESYYFPLIDTSEIKDMDIDIKVLCDHIEVKWTPPELIQQGYEINGYKFVITELNLTYIINDTKIEIEFNEEFLPNQSYTAEVSVNVCGGFGHAVHINFVTARVPAISESMNYSVTKLNNSYVSLLLKTKAQLDCVPSYPSMAVTTIFCDKRILIKDKAKDVFIEDCSGEIYLNYILLVNQSCNVTVNWRNGHGYETRSNIIAITVDHSPFQVISEFQLKVSCIHICCDIANDFSNDKHYIGCNNHYAHHGAVFGNELIACNGIFSLTCSSYNIATLNTSYIPSHTTSSAVSSVYLNEISQPDNDKNYKACCISLIAILCIFILLTIITLFLCGLKYKRHRHKEKFTGKQAIDNAIELESFSSKPNDNDIDENNNSKSGGVKNGNNNGTGTKIETNDTTGKVFANNDGVDDANMTPTDDVTMMPTDSVVEGGEKNDCERDTRKVNDSKTNDEELNNGGEVNSDKGSKESDEIINKEKLVEASSDETNEEGTLILVVTSDKNVRVNSEKLDISEAAKFLEEESNNYDILATEAERTNGNTKAEHVISSPRRQAKKQEDVLVVHDKSDKTPTNTSGDSSNKPFL